MGRCEGVYGRKQGNGGTPPSAAVPPARSTCPGHKAGAPFYKSKNPPGVTGGHEENEEALFFDNVSVELGAVDFALKEFNESDDIDTLECFGR